MKKEKCNISISEPEIIIIGKIKKLFKGKHRYMCGSDIVYLFTYLEKRIEKLEKNGSTEKIRKDNGEQSSLYKTMMKVYYDWFEVRYKMKPQIDGGDGKALKKIIAYFKLNCKDDIVIVDSWKLLFEHWNKLSKFYKEKTRLRQINSNIQNIILELKTNLSNNYAENPELFNADGSFKYGF